MTSYKIPHILPCQGHFVHEVNEGRRLDYVTLPP